MCTLMCRGLWYLLIIEVFVVWGFSSSLWYSDVYRFLSVLGPSALVCECCTTSSLTLSSHFFLGFIYIIFFFFFLFFFFFFFFLNKTRTWFTGSRDCRCCLSRFWSDVGLVGFGLCNVSMFRLYFLNISEFLSTVKFRRSNLKFTSYFMSVMVRRFGQLSSTFRVVLVLIVRFIRKYGVSCNVRFATPG